MSDKPLKDIMESFLTTKEVAALLGLSDSWVRRLIKDGKLPAKKPGHDWLVDRRDVEVYQSILELRRFTAKMRKENVGKKPFRLIYTRKDYLK